MLDSSRKGYAVMTEDLSGINFDAETWELEKLKKMCGKGYVVAERIPKHHGYHITFYLWKFYKPFCFKKDRVKNILWFHWQSFKRYFHKTGKIVYRSGEL